MPAQDVDLILFEKGGRRWAADPWDVVRVDRGAQTPAELGGGAAAARALVVRSGQGEGETHVPIDRLLGFQRVSVQELRSMPPFAQPLTSRAVIGVWLSPEEIVLLLDLQALVKESLSL